MLDTVGRAWDEVHDVIVVGSGGGGLAAALSARNEGADVLVIEKDAYIGGTTAVSGGDMWIPCNRHLADFGWQDSREDAIQYIRHISGGRESDPSLVEVFVRTASEAVNYIERHTPFRSYPHIGLNDYYSPIIDRIPGCKPFPRTVSPLPFPAGAELGELADKINRGPWLEPAELMLTESRQESVSADELTQRRSQKYRAKGGALIGALLKGLVDRDVEIRTQTRALELVLDQSGAVLGLVVNHSGGNSRIATTKGLVLACGGFECNPDMVKTYIGYDVKPISPWCNTGDGHLMAMQAGASMGSMSTFWGFGTMYDPTVIGRDGNPVAQMMIGLGPGSILVNRMGHRFMHGGYTYNDFPHGFNTFDQRYPGFPNKGPGWIVFGSSVKNTCQIMSIAPDDPAPDWIPQADSVRELAEVLGIDPESLNETVRRYNEDVSVGEDSEWGDPTQAPVVAGFESGRHAPIVGPPYYALEQWPATLGTNGGCRIDANARVLATRGGVVEGLYAVGNVAASVLGSAYLGGGTPIASSVTFGYRAGRHVSVQQPRKID